MILCRYSDGQNWVSTTYDGVSPFPYWVFAGNEIAIFVSELFRSEGEALARHKALERELRSFQNAW